MNGEGEDTKPKKKRILKEKMTKKACFHCQKSHRKCDDLRPCKNCTKSGKECYDVENKVPKKKAAPQSNNNKKVKEDGKMGEMVIGQNRVEYINNSNYSSSTSSTSRCGEISSNNYFRDVNHNCPNIMYNQTHTNPLYPTINPSYPTYGIQSGNYNISSNTGQLGSNQMNVHGSQMWQPFVNREGRMLNNVDGRVYHGNHLNMIDKNNTHTSDYFNRINNSIISDLPINNSNNTNNTNNTIHQNQNYDISQSYYYNNNNYNNENHFNENHVYLDSNQDFDISSIFSNSSVPEFLTPIEEPSNQQFIPTYQSNIEQMFNQILGNSTTSSSSNSSENVADEKPEIPPNHQINNVGFKIETPATNNTKNNTNNKIDTNSPHFKQQKKLYLQKLKEENQKLKSEMKKYNSNESQSAYVKYTLSHLFSSLPSVFLPFLGMRAGTMYYTIVFPKNIDEDSYNPQYMVIEDISENLALSMGYTPTQILKEHTSMLVPKYSPQEFKQISKAIVSGCTNNVTYMRVNTFSKSKHGMIFRVEVLAAFFCGENKKPNFVTSFVSNISVLEKVVSEDHLKSTFEII